MIIKLKIIRYIRKNKNRINIIGVERDDSNLECDYYMYKNIMKHYNPNNINYFFAHNHHINNQMYDNNNLLYIKNKNHKWYCGNYLKKN